ncbi:MAG: ribosome hibernation-promoting factor, HPF/YfiA family [Frankiaceae bacterium]
MEIVVKSRRAEVPERFREHVKGKLERLGKLDAKCYRLDVELSRERNPRLAGSRDRIELTAHSRGPVIRAEAAAADEYAALDLAAGRLEERMRRAADRRAQRHSPHVGRREGAPVSVREAAVVNAPQTPPTRAEPAEPEVSAEDAWAAPEPEGPLVVREKRHEAPPMTLDDALHHMELVGHDFYLFADLETGLPSVVYRRRGYHYGVLRLVTSPADAAQPGNGDGAARRGASG